MKKFILYFRDNDSSSLLFYIWKFSMKKFILYFRGNDSSSLLFMLLVFYLIIIILESAQILDFLWLSCPDVSGKYQNKEKPEKTQTKFAAVWLFATCFQNKN